MWCSFSVSLTPILFSPPRHERMSKRPGLIFLFRRSFLSDPDYSHLATLSNCNIKVGHVLAPIARLRCLHLLHDIHAINHLPKDNVLVVKEGSGDSCDEELGAVRVGPGIRHGQQTGLIMLHVKILIFKGLVTPDASGSRSITIQKVTALTHEVGDDSVEFGPFVSLWSTHRILGFARAELPEVFGSFGNNIREELESDATQALASKIDVKEHQWIPRLWQSSGRHDGSTVNEG